MTSHNDPLQRYHLAWATALTAALNAVRFVRGLPIGADLDDEPAISAALAAGIASMTTDMQGLRLDPYHVCRLARMELVETTTTQALAARTRVHNGASPP